MVVVLELVVVIVVVVVVANIVVWWLLKYRVDNDPKMMLITQQVIYDQISI